MFSNELMMIHFALNFGRKKPNYIDSRLLPRPGVDGTDREYLIIL